MKRSLWQENCNPAEIIFGLNRDSDERSLAGFMQLISSPDMLNSLIPRLSDDEIIEIVDCLTGMMKKHLKEDEYHSLFLQEVKS